MILSMMLATGAVAKSRDHWEQRVWDGEQFMVRVGIVSRNTTMRPNWGSNYSWKLDESKEIYMAGHRGKHREFFELRCNFADDPGKVDQTWFGETWFPVTSNKPSSERSPSRLVQFAESPPEIHKIPAKSSMKPVGKPTKSTLIKWPIPTSSSSTSDYWKCVPEKNMLERHHVCPRSCLFNPEDDQVPCSSRSSVH